MIGFPKPTKKIKKRKYIRKIGRIGRRNIKANAILFKTYFNHPDLPACEIGRASLCWRTFMGFAHRHSRVAYRAYPEYLSSFNQTLKACNPCHQWMDANREEKERIFLLKRGKDLLPSR